MQVQSFLVVLGKPGTFRALDSDYLSKISSIVERLTMSFASQDVQTAVVCFDGTSVSKQETSWVVRKDGSTAIRLVYHTVIVGQVLITTVDPLHLGIVAVRQFTWASRHAEYQRRST